MSKDCLICGAKGMYAMCARCMRKYLDKKKEPPRK